MLPRSARRALLALCACASLTPVTMAADPGSVPEPQAAVRLAPCPDRPNCVCSLSQGRAYVAPLAFADAPAAAFARLESVLRRLPRVRIVAQAPAYMRAEAASRVFRFVDDLEFALDASAGVIHVRSAARLGYSDFGVNRRRVETIRAHFGGR